MPAAQKQRKLNVLSEIVLWESPPGANVLLTARHHSATSRTSQPAPASVLLWLLESMNIGKVPASIGSSKARLCRHMLRPRCEENGLQSFWHPLSWFLQTANCPTHHDSCACAYQVLVTEVVTAQPKACNPWLKKHVDIASWAASENLLSQWQDVLPAFLSKNLLKWCHACVSAHVVPSENPRIVSDGQQQHG